MSVALPQIQGTGKRVDDEDDSNDDDDIDYDNDYGDRDNGGDINYDMMVR